MTRYSDGAPSRRSPRVHDTEAAFVPDIGHDMMLDIEWEGVADRIARWIRAGIAPAQAHEAVAQPRQSTRR